MQQLHSLPLPILRCAFFPLRNRGLGATRSGVTSSASLTRVWVVHVLCDKPFHGTLVVGLLETRAGVHEHVVPAYKGRTNKNKTKRAMARER